MLKPYIEILKNWQSLAGALIGAASALSIAVIMSSRLLNYERKKAAKLLGAELLRYRLMIDTLDTSVTNNGVDDADRPLWFCRNLFDDVLIRVPPLLPELIMTLSPIDDDLFAHLTIYFNDLELIREALKRVRELAGPGAPVLIYQTDKEELRQKCVFVYETTHVLRRHANCAISLINHFVLGPFLVLKRCFRRCCKDESCKELLKKGK
jgi:hypothetical protein